MAHVGWEGWQLDEAQGMVDVGWEEESKEQIGTVVRQADLY